MPLSKSVDPFDLLRDISPTRPFGWLPFVNVRRYLYLFVALALLGLFIFLPASHYIGEAHATGQTDTSVHPNQITLYFGALVVVAFIRYAWVVFKLWDNSKWLARYGSVEEANLLWVIHGERRLIVTYRFWTPEGKEVQKETVIDADGPVPLADLSAGDVVPVLYDPHSPRRRNMLWAEIERYVTLSAAAASARSRDLRGEAAASGRT